LLQNHNRHDLHCWSPRSTCTLVPAGEHVPQAIGADPLRVRGDRCCFDTERDPERLRRRVGILLHHDEVVVLAQKADNLGPCVCVTWVQKDLVIGILRRMYTVRELPCNLE